MAARWLEIARDLIFDNLFAFVLSASQLLAALKYLPSIGKKTTPQALKQPLPPAPITILNHVYW